MQFEIYSTFRKQLTFDKDAYATYFDHLSILSK